jgi:hypothetical protein
MHLLYHITNCSHPARGWQETRILLHTMEHIPALPSSMRYPAERLTRAPQGATLGGFTPDHAQSPSSLVDTPSMAGFKLPGMNRGQVASPS